MPKHGEIRYLRSLGPVGLDHAVNKPFSDPDCGGLLMEVGNLMTLLPPPPGKLLDLGCGPGWTSCLFAQRGYDVTGQDIAADMIYHANLHKQRRQLSNLRFLVGDYEQLSFREEFDCAVFFDSLHHAVKEEDALSAVYRALKPGGVCVTSEPGIGHAKKTASVEHVRLYNVTERDMPPSRIIRAGKQAGFRRFEVYPHVRQLHALSCQQGTPAGLLKRLIRSSAVLQGLAVTALTWLRRWRSGVVVMTK
jgi:SAM-dependent methyltransferase